MIAIDYKDCRAAPEGVLLEGVGCFSLPEILDCGQAFRWRAIGEDSYEGVACDRFLRLSMEGDRLLFHGIGMEEFEAVWRDYFDLSRDYGALRERLAADPVLEKAMAFAPGIRVLRQPPWEALCSFILSQNNNIKRIKGLVERFCDCFGEEREGIRAFPTPERIAALEPDDLAPVRAGFRAKYLVDAARRVVSGEVSLSLPYTLPIDEARAHLMQIHGVGVKVADCALLYGFSRVECVPKDVWINRVMEQLYPDGFPEELADVAGIAQQYLFHYARCCPDALAARGAK
ncbi:MAG: DNA-3-methyladenine glycosylase family protein [Oscillospiraceae bacterium]